LSHAGLWGPTRHDPERRIGGSLDRAASGARYGTDRPQGVKPRGGNSFQPGLPRWRRIPSGRRPRQPVPQRASSCPRYAATVLSTWSMESPPNFSRKASARVRATMASPTTEAAGTEVTSER